MTSFFEFVGRTEIMILGLAVALFLTLYWLVRGAPIGQTTTPEPKDSPPTGYRDRAAALAVFGLICVLLGAYVAGDYGIPWSIPLFGLGYFLIMRTISANRRFRHVSPTLRRTVEFAQTSFTFTLLAGVLLIINIFAFKYGGKPIDFTHDEAFTLSSMSVNAVKKLERPLKFTMVLGRDEMAGRSRDRVRQLVDLYKGQNPSKIEVNEITAFDPAKVAELDDLIKRTPDLAMNRGDSIVMEYGEGPSAVRAVMPVLEMFRLANPAATNEARLSTSFSGEDAITSAISRFQQGKRALVAFSTGHGEPPLDALDVGQAGLGIWKSRLSSLGTDATEINLIKEDVPAAASLLVIVWPKTAFLENELDRIKSYLAGGRPLLLITNAQYVAGLESVINPHNVSFEPGRILDAELNAGNRIDQVVTPPAVMPEHDIMAPLARLPFLVPNASPLKVVGLGQTNRNEPKAQVNPAFIAQPFLRTSPKSWGEMKDGSFTFDPTTDKRGPLVVGAAVWERVEPINGAKNKPRMVVLSSPGFALNSTLREASTNLDLLMNAVVWLKGKNESLGVAPKVHNAVLFTADANLRAKLHLVPTVISAVFILGFGVILYLARRA